MVNEFKVKREKSEVGKLISFGIIKVEKNQCKFCKHFRIFYSNFQSIDNFICSKCFCILNKKRVNPENLENCFILKNKNDLDVEIEILRF